MDHAIDSLQPFYEAELGEVVEEYGSGKYKKVSDCPSYPALKALTDAINRLNKYMGWERINASLEVKIRIRERKAG